MTRAANTTPASARRRSRLRRFSAIATAVLLASAIALSACGGDDDAPAANAGAATVSAAVPGATRVPQTLPLTPVAGEFYVNDPAFEALPGARAMYGEQDGAGWQIEVPDNWNGDVVYYAHGFRGNMPALIVTAPPLRDYFISHGYAWAASSYDKNGYEPGSGARTTLALRDIFAAQVGAPRTEYLYGQSMGGHVVSLSLESYGDAYDGALSECGVVSGHEILDYFLSWGTLSAYFAGTDLYGVTDDADDFADAINDDVRPALGDVKEPTAAGRRFASAVMQLTGGPRPFFHEGYASNYALNFGILAGAVSSPGAANGAASNAATVYAIDDGLGVTAEQLNNEVQRVTAIPEYRDRANYPEFADMTGSFTSPHLALHGTGDLFVPISLQQSYRKIVDAAGNGDRLVQRAIRRSGHCNFTAAERERAFEDLVAWVTQGTKPEGDDLNGDLSDIGLRWTSPLEASDPGSLR